MKAPRFYCGPHNSWRTFRTRLCPDSGKPATRLKRIGHVAKTILTCPDIPEHFNITIGMPVRSRRHLTDLQKRHGFRDYEGMRGASQSHVFGEGGEVRRLRRSERVHG